MHTATKRSIGLLLIGVILAASAPAPPRAAESTAPTGIIHGTLVDDNGQPMVGYRIKVTDTAGNSFPSEPTGAEGRWEITGLPPGTYTYGIMSPSGEAVTVRIPPITLEAGTAVTQPIAIVPRKKGGKGPLIAWIAGGAGAVALAALIAANNDNGNEKSMTPGGGM